MKAGLISTEVEGKHSQLLYACRRYPSDKTLTLTTRRLSSLRFPLRSCTQRWLPYFGGEEDIEGHALNTLLNKLSEVVH